MHKAIVTFFGLGYAPKAPGTVGALGGILLFALLQWWGISQWLFSIVLLFVFFLGVYSSSQIEKQWGKDNGKVVIDEVLGVGVSLLFVPFHWHYYVLGFVLFRLFDIWKPLFIRSTEKLKGGWGVMTDDLVAGVVANLVLQILILISERSL